MAGNLLYFEIIALVLLVLVLLFYGSKPSGCILVVLDKDPVVCHHLARLICSGPAQCSTSTKNSIRISCERSTLSH